MSFQFVDERATVSDPVAHEHALLQQRQTPLACAWAAQPALVVPRSYVQLPGFKHASAQMVRGGTPVFVRPSGGGLVPQGPGIINLSLVYPLPDGRPPAVDTLYLHLCGILQQALSDLGIHTHWQAVQGSFCDGRFNLAVGSGAQARKIAGTAQYWRLRGSRDPARTASRYDVLAHAVLLVAPDLEGVHDQANRFERLLGSGRCYAPEKTASIAQLQPGRDPAELMARVRTALRAAVASAGPPR